MFPKPGFVLRAFFFLLIAAACAAQTITFTSTAIPVGMRRVCEDSSAVHMIMEMAGMEGAGFDMSMKRAQHKTESVMAYESGLPLKTAVSYSLAEESRETPFGAERGGVAAKPVLDRIYIVERTETGLAVLNDEGQPAPEVEAIYVKRDFADEFGTQFADSLRGRTLTVGDSLALDMRSMRELLKGIPSRAIRPMLMLTLEGVREEQGMKCAVFKTRLVLPAGDEGSAIRSEVAGTLRIGVENCWVLAFTMQGPIAFSGSRRGVEVTGTGELRSVHHFTYVK